MEELVVWAHTAKNILFNLLLIILELCYSSLKFLTITDLGTIEFVNDLNYIVSAGISARDVYSIFRAERRAVVTPEPRPPWGRVPTGAGPREALRDSGQSGCEWDKRGPRLGGGGVTSDFKWQGWSKDLLGFEIFDFVIFFGGVGGVGKFWQVSGAHNLQLLFSGFSRSLEIFYGSETGHGIFLRLNFFGPGIFLGFVWSPTDFFRFLIFPSFDHPCHHLCHLNPE